MSSNIKILIVDDEEYGRDTYQMLVESSGFEAVTAGSADEARELLEANVFQIVLCDINMPKTDGITFLKEIKSRSGDRIEVIMITGYASVDTAVEAMKTGAFGYFIKSGDPAELLMEIDKAVDRLIQNNAEFQESEKEPEYILSSKSKLMQKVWQMVDLVAASHANILITGESGTGKEIIASQIHARSDRKKAPYVALNCQQYPDELIESELFGHEKGAYTGATGKRIGKLEQANGGTVFLDEIGDISMETQTKLLRTLEQRVIERIGSNEVCPVDFRLITATNKDIPVAIKEGTFREDFYYRINTIEIKIPPLRQRREDLPDLIDFFVKKFSRDMSLPIKEMDAGTRDYLLNYDYPGNIRELKNTVERMIILSGNSDLLKLNGELGSSPAKQIHKPSEDNDMVGMAYKDAKAKFELEYISQILSEHKGNITQAAKAMDMSRRQLFNKINELDINADEFK